MTPSCHGGRGRCAAGGTAGMDQGYGDGQAGWGRDPQHLHPEGDAATATHPGNQSSAPA